MNSVIIILGDKMKALITGASSGIGREMAIYLAELGYDIIVVARSKDKLEDLKKSVKTNVTIYEYDLAKESNCYKLYDNVKNDKVDIVINNAGFGLFGDYKETDLDTEINMIDLNIKALHILTKLAVNNKDTKYILNVASSAGLMIGGPLMSTYYATKSYVRSYTLGIYEELRKRHSDKIISVLCPGPVKTNFNKRANVKFNLKELDAKYVARYAIDKMFKKKLVIIPGLMVRMGLFFSRFLPNKLALNIVYHIQERKKTP